MNKLIVNENKDELSISFVWNLIILPVFQSDTTPLKSMTWSPPPCLFLTQSGSILNSSRSLRWLAPSFGHSPYRSRLDMLSPWNFAYPQRTSHYLIKKNLISSTISSFAMISLRAVIVSIVGEQGAYLRSPFAISLHLNEGTDHSIAEIAANDLVLYNCSSLTSTWIQQGSDISSRNQRKT